MRREIPPKKNSCLTGIDVLNIYMWWDFQLYRDVAFRQELNFLMFKWGKIWILLYKLYHENFLQNYSWFRFRNDVATEKHCSHEPIDNTVVLFRRLLIYSSLAIDQYLPHFVLTRYY